MPADRPERNLLVDDDEGDDPILADTLSPDRPHTERRRLLQRAIPNARLRRAVEWLLLVVLALIAAALLRTYVVQSFYIPSPSMEPTLEEQDRILVNKLAYRFGDPGRGDVVVFEAPPGEGTAEVRDLIKRVIALPGETVEGRNGSVYINGKQLPESWLPRGTQSRSFPAEVVPEDHYWVMGDNRLQSRDSTFFKSIPRSSIIGKAFVRIWPLSRFGTI